MSLLLHQSASSFARIFAEFAFYPNLACYVGLEGVQRALWVPRTNSSSFGSEVWCGLCTTPGSAPYDSVRRVVSRRCYLSFGSRRHNSNGPQTARFHRRWGPHDNGCEDEITRGWLVEIVRIFTNQSFQKWLHFWGPESHRLEFWRLFLLPVVHPSRLLRQTWKIRLIFWKSRKFYLKKNEKFYSIRRTETIQILILKKSNNMPVECNIFTRWCAQENFYACICGRGSRVRCNPQAHIRKVRRNLISWKIVGCVFCRLPVPLLKKASEELWWRRNQQKALISRLRDQKINFKKFNYSGALLSRAGSLKIRSHAATQGKKWGATLQVYTGCSESQFPLLHYVRMWKAGNTLEAEASRGAASSAHCATDWRMFFSFCKARHVPSILHIRRGIPRACLTLIYRHAIARIVAVSEACGSARCIV